MNGFVTDLPIDPPQSPTQTVGNVTYHWRVEQRSEEWFKLRCGLLTASEMKMIVTPTLKVANNDKLRMHLFELAAQRANDYVEPSFQSDDMFRGTLDEVDAGILYSNNYKMLQSCGFITNNKWGFTLGYSPDALIDDDGVWECKSMCQKKHFKVILDNKVPEEHYVQVQAALMISERSYADYTNYCGGMPMTTMTAYPDEKVQEVLAEAAANAEKHIEEHLQAYRARLVEPDARFLETERRITEEEIL